MDSPQVMRENLDRVLQFMAAKRIRMTHITSKEVVEGNLKSVMRIILALAAHYKPQSVKGSNSNNNSSSSSTSPQHHQESSPLSSSSAIVAGQAAPSSAPSGRSSGGAPPPTTHGKQQQVIKMLELMVMLGYLRYRYKASLSNFSYRIITKRKMTIFYHEL